MRTWKRLRVTLQSQFDDLVNRMENQAAVADSIICEIEQAAAKAQVQHKRLLKDRDGLHQKWQAALQGTQKWRQRAKDTASEDRAKAVECLKRVERCEQEATDLEGQLRQMTATEQQLNEDLLTIGNKLQLLKQKRNSLACRETTMEALAATHSDNSSLMCELDGLFDRWETKVAVFETYANTPATSGDPLAKEFDDAEQQQRLEQDLDRLLGQDKEERHEHDQ